MNSHILDANTIHLHSILKEMAIISEEILLAGVQGIESDVRRGFDRFRQLNSDLGIVDQKYTAYFDTISESEKLELLLVLEKIKKSEHFRSAWRQRYNDLVSNELLLELPDGPGGVIDMVLPEAWDWNYDIIAFSNYSDARLINLAFQRGQKRIVIYCLDGFKNNQLSDIVTYVNDSSDIDKYISSLSPNGPTRIIIFDKIIELRHKLSKELRDLDSKFIANIQKSFERHVVNLNTIRLLGNKWINQAIKNTSIIAEQPSFAHLKDKFNKLPLIIISPGPSLDKNIKYLKDLEKKAILLAPAQSIMALQKEGIVPDIVMVCDPNDLLYLFDGYDMSRVHALLIGVSCNPELFKKYQKKIISFSVNGPLDNWVTDIFEDESPRGACGSVSSMAFLLGTNLQCNPIILVGQDLSFDGKKQYSQGAADGDVTVTIDDDRKTFNYSSVNAGFEKIINEMLGKNYIGFTTTLPGYYGGEVITKPDYAMFHADFERIAKNALEFENPPALFNCTEGGVFINGFDHISLTNAIELIDKKKLPLLQKEELFKSIFISVDRQSRKKLLKNALNNISQTLTSSINLAEECLCIVEKTDKNEIDLFILSKKEMELKKNIKDSYFISIAVQEQIRSIIRLSENATTLEQNINVSKLLYQIVINEAKKIQPSIESTIKELIAPTLNLDAHSKGIVN